jgi:UDP-N-acetyl-D-glucosamine dehydrogenase
MRESPSIKLMELLIERGAEVAFHDPLIPVIPPSHEHPQFDGWEGVPLTDLRSYDAIVIATDHRNVDYAYYAENASLVVDTRNAMGKRGYRAKHIVKA